MNDRHKIFPMLLVCFALVLSACNGLQLDIPLRINQAEEQSEAASAPVESAQQPAEQEEPPSTKSPVQAEREGTEQLTGTFAYTNEFWPEDYAYEHAVILLDMTGFVRRDDEYEISADSQVIGITDLDEENNRGTYRLQLPVAPKGEFNDVDHNGRQDNGVQIFAVEYAPNISHGPFYRDDDKYLGWPGYLASITIDRENENEVTGGRLLVWAPDGNQQFPTGFGEDGELFTDDDPLADFPAGYSVIDLDQSPFSLLRDQSIEMALYEPADAAVKDFADLTYSQSFDEMFEIVRREYAFNGVPGKEPNWDELYSEIALKIILAEQNNSPEDFYRALHAFSLAFKDGHVGLDGGALGNQFVRSKISSGYGFAVRELDDESVIVVYVNPDSPAGVAGIREGAVITEFNGQPISEAIGEVEILEPQSTDFALRYQQQRYLLRAPTGSEAIVTYINPGLRTPQRVTLKAVEEFASFSATSIFLGYDPDALPVEFWFLPTGIGYVRVNSNYDDLNLIKRLFERALQTFEANQVPGIMIDMRLNFGGAPLELAGFLTDQEILMGQLEYYSDRTGQFEPDGPRDKVYPSVHQYDFPRMAMLVDQSCFSACEIEAYGFSQVPGMAVIGMYPTAGVEAETARGMFLLPEDISLTIPTGRFTLPDGSIFLEGQGVPPTQRVPITEETVLSEEDVVLEAAQSVILQ